MILLSAMLVGFFLNSGVLVNADGRHYYYPYVHSIVFDGDIDLTDDYGEAGLTHWYYTSRTATGKAPSVSPAGSPLLILPFYAAAHAGVVLGNRTGLVDANPDGYSRPYQLAYCLGSLAYTIAGLFLLFHFLCRYFSRTESLFLTILAFLATPLIYYVYHEPSAVTGTAFFTGSLFFALLSRMWDSLACGRVPIWAALGLTAGVGMMVRWEQVFFPLAAGLVLAYLLARSVLSLPSVLRAGVAFSGGYLLGFAPQVLIWISIWGSPFTLPQGSEMHWTRPFLAETLFSSRNGLFAFTPLSLVAVAGLLIALRRHTAAAGLALICLISVIYMNSAYEEWWGATSFGMRRVLGLVAPLMAGCGLLWQAASRLIAGRPRTVGAVALSVFAAMNCLFFVQFKQDKVDLYKNRSFTSLLTDQLEMILHRSGYPFSWPANWLFAARYGVSPEKYDMAAGNYLFSWDIHEPTQTITFGRDDDAYLGFGFSQPESDKDGARWRWSQGRRSEILVSLFRPTRLQMKLTVMPFMPPGARPQRMLVTVNGNAAETVTMRPGVAEYSVLLQPDWLSAGINAIVFDYDYAVVPATIGMGRDQRELAVQFRRCSFTLRGGR